MIISITLPRVGRRRAVTTCSMAATAMTLWFWAAYEGVGGMALGWRIVVGGLVIPWGWAWSALLYAEYRIEREWEPVAHRPLPEHDRAGAR